MPKRIHLCMSVRGFLNQSIRDHKRALKTITKNDGSRFRDVHELRNAFMEELAQGHEVIPVGEECEGFDYKKGCPGHEMGGEAEGK